MKREDREADIENHLVRRVKERGGEVRKVAWIGRPHAPDRVVMLPPRIERATEDNASYQTGPALIWVELKAPGKKARPGQLREHARMRKLGQEVFVVDSREGVDRLFG